jgi:hypothetical protein
LEVEGDATGSQTAWPMVGPALLTHATMRGLNHVTIDLEPPRKQVVPEHRWTITQATCPSKRRSGGCLKR